MTQALRRLAVAAMVLAALAFSGCADEGAPETVSCRKGVREVRSVGGKGVAVCRGGNVVVLP
jgi:hypothetical protein